MVRGPHLCREERLECPGKHAGLMPMQGQLIYFDVIACFALPGSVDQRRMCDLRPLIRHLNPSKSRELNSPEFLKNSHLQGAAPNLRALTSQAVGNLTLSWLVPRQKKLISAAKFRARFIYETARCRCASIMGIVSLAKTPEHDSNGLVVVRLPQPRPPFRL